MASFDHNSASASAHSAGRSAKRSGGVPFRPCVVRRVATTGMAIAAASSSLFLMPPPLTNGSTTAPHSRTAGRMSGRSAVRWMPSRPANRVTAGVGWKP